MIVEEFKIRQATVKINDAFINSREKSEKIMENVEGIILRNLNAQVAKGKTFDK